MPLLAFRLFKAAGWLVVGALLSTPVRAAEPYRLQQGDSIDFTLIGNSPIQRRIVIMQDGLVRLPLGGAVEAAGRTIDEVRDDVVERLKAVSYPAGVDEKGVTIWNVIYPESVMVEMGDYLPVYLTGDVLTPGSQVFRFGLTVSQAVAVSGGLSAFRSRRDFSLDEAGLGEEEKEARISIFRAELRIARLRAELDGEEAPNLEAVSSTGLDDELAADLRGLEDEQFEARKQDLHKSRQNLEASVVSAKRRFGYLKEAQSNLEAETRNYEDEVRRVEALLRKGLTPIDRLATAQRGVFLVSTRSLDTSAEVSRVEREITDLTRGITKLDDTARMENLEALQAAATAKAQGISKLETVRLKNSVVAGAVSRDNAARFMVSRRNGDAVVRREAMAEEMLKPGDLVEVFLTSDRSDDERTDASSTTLFDATAEKVPTDSKAVILPVPHRASR